MGENARDVWMKALSVLLWSVFWVCLLGGWLVGLVRP